MRLTPQQVNAVSGAIWLIGIGALFATGWWWPGIMFVIGTSSVVQGIVAGRGWYAFQAGLWSFGIGVWAMTGFNLAVLFVLLAVSGMLAAFVRPPSDEKQVIDRSTSLE